MAQEQTRRRQRPL